MNSFSNIKELLSTLVREHKLLTEMFEKRKTLSYKYDFALELVEYNEDRLHFLINYSVMAHFVYVIANFSSVYAVIVSISLDKIYIYIS